MANSKQFVNLDDSGVCFLPPLLVDWTLLPRSVIVGKKVEFRVALNSRSLLCGLPIQRQMSWSKAANPAN